MYLWGGRPAADKPALKALMEALVGLLQSTIGSIDFWQNPDKQKRLRGDIKSAIGKSELVALKAQRERVAIEVVRLAKNRHDALLRATPDGTR